MPLEQDRFAHLHVHSEYSMLDGITGPYTLVRTAGHLGQPAIAITDHGSLSGTVLFWDAISWYNGAHAEHHAYDPKSCPKNWCHTKDQCLGLERCEKDDNTPKAVELLPSAEAHATLAPIKGIMGIETYVADKGRAERTKGDWGHLVLLARDEQGWRNLMELASLASIEGFYSKPRIDLESLEGHSEGLIALSACLGGHLASVRQDSGEEAAIELIRRYQAILGADNYFLEIQWHNDQDLASGDPTKREQHELNKFLIRASETTGAPLVMTNDLHYARREQAADEEIVLANQQNLTLAELAAAKAAGKHVLGFDTPDFYLKSRLEMGQALGDWLRQTKIHDPATAAIIARDGGGWLDRTLTVAERCALAKPFPKGLHFPNFPIPERLLDLSIENEDERQEKGARALLTEIVWDRATERYGKPLPEKIRRLIAYELEAILTLDFASYFLLVGDFIDWACKRGIHKDRPGKKISVGLGRGSAPGSIVTYVTGITNLDPVHYGLTDGGIGLTRFLNPTVYYLAQNDDLGDLPETAQTPEEELPSWQEMADEIAAVLRERGIARNIAFRDGTAGDLVTGEPYNAERMAMEQGRWKDHLALLGQEWALIRGRAAAEASGEIRGMDTPQKDPKYPYSKGSIVPVFWRWLRHVRASGDRGTRNVLQSNLAVFLGLTTARPDRVLEDGSVPFLPHYKFAHSRIGMPDIDTDFTPGPDGREAVMRYVVERYGADHVCQIATFSTMLAKSALRDVARAKGFLPHEIDELTLLIPKKFLAVVGDTDDDTIPGVTLKEMISSDHPAVVEGAKPMRERMAADPRVDDVIRIAARLEGTKRGVSTHACGVLITPRPVTDYVPVMRVDKGTGRQAVFDGPTLDKLGLLKADFLGLKNLPINDLAVERVEERTRPAMLMVPTSPEEVVQILANRAINERIKETHGLEIDWQTVPDDDPDAMRLLCEGRTTGIFQFNSNFATGILKRIKPSTVRDLAVATALGRPGPMDYIPDYVAAREAGKATYGDPVWARLAAPILDPTFGIMVFQEQMMRLSVEVAGFTLTESDGLRKGAGKKKKDVLEKYGAQFRAGAAARGVDPVFCEQRWFDVVKFGGYAFNASHAFAYALTAYKQAYLKAKWPAEFLAALGTVEQNEQSREKGGPPPLAKVISEARTMGFRILPPDVNESTERIEIVDAKTLRLSLACLKGVGDRPIEAIVAERAKSGKFASFGDFLTRCVEAEPEPDPATGKKIKAVNKTAVVALIKVGAFDTFDDRSALLARYEAYAATTSAKKRAAIDWSPIPTDMRPRIVPRTYLDWENELTGVFASAHPSESISEEERAKANCTVADVLTYTNIRDRLERHLVGVVRAIAVKPTRNGSERLIGIVEDVTGECQFTYWKPKADAPGSAHKAYAAFRDAMTELPADAIHFTGGFSYNERFDKAPVFMVNDWELIKVARLAPAPPPVSKEPSAADLAARSKAESAKVAQVLETSETSTQESLDLLFSGDQAA